MHPFGGTQYCPRCSQPVYAAEQVMGPGRKLYHKPCLACMACNKRLDSYTLLEHDQMPYCKSCHVKNFGNRDLRQANLPHHDIAASTNSPSSSPPATPPVRVSGNADSYIDGMSAPRLRPHRLWTASPVSSSETPPSNEILEDENNEESLDTVDESSVSSHPSSQPPPPSTIRSNTGRPGFGGIPRTISLSPTRGSGASAQSRHYSSNSVDLIRTPSPKIPFNRFAGTLQKSVETQTQVELTRPLAQTSTGTRYGAALGGGMGTQTTGGGSPSKWGMGTPSCPRCGKSVYFAEQVKAVGKTYHKGCLRCTECSTLLDSSRLRDHDGEPLCVRCYGKLHGPQGAGYALLGKAGG